MPDCTKHGKYIGERCPVCEGRSTGTTWSTRVGPRYRAYCPNCGNETRDRKTCESCGTTLEV